MENNELVGMVWPMMACPKCHNRLVDNMQTSYTEQIVPLEEETFDDCVVSGFKAIGKYKCHCKVCGEEYEVKWGMSSYRKYDPPYYDTQLGDVLVYVRYYGNEMHRGYKIISVDDVPMMMIDEDEYPIILTDQEKDELVNDHVKARIKANDTWMNRYR